jgi:hypothetical protein
MGIKIIQPYFPDQPTVNLYDPSIRISDEFLKPPTGPVSGQRFHVVLANPEHLNDFGMVPEGQTRIDVLRRRLSQFYVLAGQNHHRCHRYPEDFLAAV